MLVELTYDSTFKEFLLAVPLMVECVATLSFQLN